MTTRDAMEPEIKPSFPVPGNKPDDHASKGPDPNGEQPDPQRDTATIDDTADDIIESARVQAERMVERTEIAREARRIAQKTVDDADAQARRLRLECEDYIDHKLAEFEVVLERTRQAVENGRAQLQVTIDPLEPEEPEDLDAGGFFDQDES